MYSMYIPTPVTIIHLLYLRCNSITNYYYYYNFYLLLYRASIYNVMLIGESGANEPVYQYNDEQQIGRTRIFRNIGLRPSVHHGWWFFLNNFKHP